MKLGTNKEMPFGSTTTSRPILVFFIFITYIYKEVAFQPLVKLFHSLSMKYLGNP